MTPGSVAELPIAATASGAVLAVTVAPRASKTVLERLSDGTIRVRVTSPPIDGAANTALLHFLADLLDLPPSRLSIASGGKSRRKRIAVKSLGVDELREKVEKALAPRG